MNREVIKGINQYVSYDGMLLIVFYNFVFYKQSYVAKPGMIGDIIFTILCS